MKITLSLDETLEVQFQGAEQVFEIVHNKEGFITIVQTSGFEMGTGVGLEDDPNENEFKVIYEEEGI